MRTSLRRRLWTVAALLTALTLAPSVAPTVAPAGAATNQDAGTLAACTSTHCYWIASWAVSPPSGFTGASTNVRANCLVVSQASPYYFVTNELWILDPAGNWIESGIVYGHPLGRPTSQGGTVYFWGDRRPGYGFSGHYSTTAYSFGTYQRMAIRKTGSATWDVRSGPILGTSTSSLTSATRLDTGMEAYTDTTNNVIAQSSSSSMTWYSLSGAAVTGWASGSGHAVLRPTPGVGYVRWAHTYDWIQYGVNSCSAFTAQAPGSASTSRQRSVREPATRSDLYALALRIAAQSGELRPTSVVAAPTTRARALTVVTPGQSVNEDGEAFVLTIRGRFVGTTAPRPTDAPAPTGTVLSVVLDAATLEVTDVALGDTPPDVARLGSVVRLG